MNPPEGIVVTLSDLNRLLNDALPLWETQHDRDHEGALRLLAAIRRERQALATTEAILEATCAKWMPTDRVELPGLLAERKGGALRTKWRTPDLASAVVTRYLTDPDSGEIADPDSDASEAARGTAELLLELAQVAYWRTTALKAFGIDPDAYCVKERGRRTVVIREGDSTEPASEPLRVVA